MITENQRFFPAKIHRGQLSTALKLSVGGLLALVCALGPTQAPSQSPSDVSNSETRHFNPGNSIPGNPNSGNLATEEVGLPNQFDDHLVKPDSPSPSSSNQHNQPQRSQTRAVALVDQMIQRFAYGPAFRAQVRQRVWAAGSNLVGTGEYTQTGSGSGRFHLFVTMHDGTGKHNLRQISDGRIAWTRTQIGSDVQLTRVDVGWLEEGVRASEGLVASRPGGRVISPRMKIGAWTEMLERLKEDYILTIGKSELDSRPLYVVSGQLRQPKRAEIESGSPGGSLSELYPTRVNVVVALTDDPKTGFGAGLPIQFRFWSDPARPVDSDSTEPANETANGDSEPVDQNNSVADRNSVTPAGRMISMIEIYEPELIEPPDVKYFRFVNDDMTIDINNETGKYEKRFGIRVTARERARQRW